MMDWNNEVTPDRLTGGQGGGYQSGQGAAMPSTMQQELSDGVMQLRPQLDLRNNVSDETVESPLSTCDAYLGSLKATLQRNRGNYMVATFLIGTQNTVSFEGILYEVGNDFVTIYQPGRERYVVVDMYSLKYMEFFDHRDGPLCQVVRGEDGVWRTL